MTFRRFDPYNPLIVNGVIRLADKCCIESLREHLVKVVVSDWPTTLQEWDVFPVEIQAVENKLAITNAGKVMVSDLDFVRDHIPLDSRRLPPLSRLPRSSGATRSCGRHSISSRPSSPFMTSMPTCQCLRPARGGTF